MSEEGHRHSREFETETRERLASLEAHQENLQSTVEDIRDGQDDVMERLDELGSDFVTEEQIQEIEDEIESNTISRERKQAIVQALITLASVGGGITAYVHLLG